MSQQPVDPRQQAWENRLREQITRFPYPATPDVSGSVRRRLFRRSTSRAIRLTWVVILLLALLCGLLAVPQVRAAILDWLRVGSVIILPNGPSATPLSSAPPSAGTAQFNVPLTATPIPSLLRLAGETTLDRARETARFSIRLPAYPLDLGPPDKVYVQDLMGQAVILVWTDATRPDGIRLSLHFLSNDTLAFKVAPKILKETAVHGQRALWMEGPYILAVKRGNQTDMDMTRIVNGQVLLWAEERLTYRLEGGGLTLEEALRIAESIPPAPATPTAIR